jgi:hypothetical protein
MLARRPSRTAPPSSDPVTLVVDALATYRFTRLLVSDGIADRPRAALLRRLERGGHGKLVELLDCPWCTGFWVAASVVASRRIAGRWWGPVAEAFAFAAVTGLAASAVRQYDDSHDVLVAHADDDDELIVPTIAVTA